MRRTPSKLPQSRPPSWWLVALVTTLLLALLPLRAEWVEQGPQPLIELLRAHSIGADFTEWLERHWQPPLENERSYWREGIEGDAFDLLSSWRPPAPRDDVVLVAIDDNSLDAFGRWPWPRRLHAQLIRSLKAAGAKVIAFDVVFSDAGNPEDDHALAEAVREAGNVVLASDVVHQRLPQGDYRSNIQPFPELMEAGAHAGLVTMGEARVLRHLPAASESFPRAILRVAGMPAPETPPGVLLQYFGPPGSFPTVAYYQAIDAGNSLPPGTFTDKLVIVGLDVRAMPELRVDRFATPFTLLTREQSPGIEVHATAVENLRMGITITPLGVPTLLAALALVTFWSAFLSRRFQPLRSSASASALLIGVAALSLVLLHDFHLWLPPPVLLLGVALPWLIQGTTTVLRERALRQFIARAFSHYLSPAMVERLQNHPELLRLGGETRDLTIMFCDIRGFTTLSERFKDDPERLTQLINRFLTPMTAVILSRNGTIDKYIGDSIMAFWNAPVEEAHHAENGCRAALEMLAALGTLNRELAAEAAQRGEAPIELRIGIGINTGRALVGNLGSEQRFAFSVLGDAVNLASRLEGASKNYGVPIVIGPQTAAAVADTMPLLELDLIAVKGKAEAVRIFTLPGPAQQRPEAPVARLITAQQALLAAYRSGDWERARAALSAVRATGLVPALCALYEQRITQYEQEPPAPDWGGVFVATSK